MHFVCRFADSRDATAGKKLAASYGHIVSTTWYEGATNFARNSWFWRRNDGQKLALLLSWLHRRLLSLQRLLL